MNKAKSTVRTTKHPTGHSSGHPTGQRGVNDKAHGLNRKPGRKVAIVETGAPAAPLREQFGGYADMFRAALPDGEHGLKLDVLPLYRTNIMPARDEYDGYIFTGSPYGVYEDHSFIEPSMEFIRLLIEKSIPVAGICFGHQLMAKAMGARVEKSTKGWGVGVHTYAVDANKVRTETGSMAGALREVENLSCVVSHQDQVLNLADGITCLGGSDFCPNGILQYGDGPAISFQMHPEFTHEFSRALLISRKDRLSEEVFNTALNSYDQKTDRKRMLTMLSDFFQQADHKISSNQTGAIAPGN